MQYSTKDIMTYRAMPRCFPYRTESGTCEVYKFVTIDSSGRRASVDGNMFPAFITAQEAVDAGAAAGIVVEVMF